MSTQLPADWEVLHATAEAAGWCLSASSQGYRTPWTYSAFRPEGIWPNYERRQWATAAELGAWVAQGCPSEGLRFVSLFAGIGGLDLGLERAGMQCVAQVEIEDYASKVLAKHWPNVARFRDVREVGAHNLPACDLICGGFPCQDISDAGKRIGITGERSGLWREFARIIRNLRPRYALIENVSALLGRGLDVVLCDLAALGYDAEWSVVSGCSLGAPHTRERVFIVAYPNSIGRERRGVFEGGAWRDPSPDTATRQVQSRFWQAPFDFVRGMAHGSTRRMDKASRLKGAGNAVVPQVAEFIGRAIVAHAQAQRLDLREAA